LPNIPRDGLEWCLRLKTHGFCLMSAMGVLFGKTPRGMAPCWLSHWVTQCRTRRSAPDDAGRMSRSGRPPKACEIVVESVFLRPMPRSARPLRTLFANEITFIHNAQADGGVVPRGDPRTGGSAPQALTNLTPKTDTRCASDVAHALVRAVSALVPTLCVAAMRREESRRGTHECVRHSTVPTVKLALVGGPPHDHTFSPPRRLRRFTVQRASRFTRSPSPDSR
jgi:hypothetical protein